MSFKVLKKMATQISIPNGKPLKTEIEIKTFLGIQKQEEFITSYPTL